MRAIRHFLFIVFAMGLIVISIEQAEAKKKTEKAMPVKIIKASETQFKHAKIVKTKEVKPKRFLWFKKKSPKVKKPKMARVVEEPLQIEILDSEAEEIRIIPTEKRSHKVEESQPKELVESPEIVQGSVESPKASK